MDAKIQVVGDRDKSIDLGFLVEPGGQMMIYM